MSGTVQAAGQLYAALSPQLTDAEPSATPLDPIMMAGFGADEIMDALVETVRAIDGTLDAEATRHAIRDSLSRLLDRYPDANFLALSELQRMFAIEQFVAADVFNRFRLDLGKAVQEKAPTPTAALARLQDVKDYVTESIRGSFRKITTDAVQLDANQVSGLVAQVLEDTFEVFAGYIS